MRTESEGVIFICIVDESCSRIGDFFFYHDLSWGLRFVYGSTLFFEGTMGYQVFNRELQVNSLVSFLWCVCLWISLFIDRFRQGKLCRDLIFLCCSPVVFLMGPRKVYFLLLCGVSWWIRLKCESTSFYGWLCMLMGNVYIVVFNVYLMRIWLIFCLYNIQRMKMRNNLLRKSPKTGTLVSYMI